MDSGSRRPKSSKGGVLEFRGLGESGPVTPPGLAEHGRLPGRRDRRDLAEVPVRITASLAQTTKDERTI
jgi:hypothetical protein